ncbi:MAG: alpha/beta hydrolase [Ardenticatenaceae bacterium]|nr:alpha/beta hydrolase [Ardenticatenaceae bacterium]
MKVAQWNKRKRWMAAGLVAIILLLIVGPFLVPVPPLEDTVPATELADADSQFVDVNGLDIHLKMAGSGQPVFILLHGFAATWYSWHAVMPELAAMGTVIAFDRPAFGLTERPLPDQWQTNPYTPEAQTELVIGLMNTLGIKQAILVGNSAGGSIAIDTTLRYPDRVQALILVDAAVYTGGGTPAFLRPLLNTPQLNHLGPLIARASFKQLSGGLELAWHNPANIPPETAAAYGVTTQVDHWDEAFWQFVAASHAPDLAGKLDQLALPTLVISGDDDRIVPLADSLRLGEAIVGAETAVLPNCGHLPQEECPDAFMQAVTPFVEQLPSGITN